MMSGSHSVIQSGYNSMADSFRLKAEALLFVLDSFIVEWEAYDWVLDFFPLQSRVVNSISNLSDFCL